MGIPKQRGPGQSGGRYGQNANARASRARGGSPGAGGGGKKGGCAIFAILALSLASTGIYGASQLLG